MALMNDIVAWDSSLSTPFYRKSFNSIYEILDYHEKNFFGQFIPTSSHAHQDFWQRLEYWLKNVSDVNDKKALFEFTLYIQFITREDFNQLFLSAFSGPVKRWIIDLYNINLDQRSIDDEVNLRLHKNNGFNHTWYCSVTDMNIGEFYRINHIEGHDVRPDLNTLATMGDEQHIHDYMSGRNIEQIVLLEDFVGSGSQFRSTLEKSLKYFGGKPTLFVPLFICSNGLADVSDVLAGYGNWRIDPVVVIDEGDRLHPGTDSTNKPLENKIIQIAKDFSSRIRGSISEELVYGCGKTGALIVLHSNTPDNTMPFIWWNKNDSKWNPLFPRSNRS